MKSPKEEKAIKRFQMQKIKVKQVRSPIGRKSIQKKILISLGLNKINRERVLENTPSINGMINKVKHLVKVEPKDTK
ncbi:MAG: 50S ribosomal protein L30 [Rickettsiales bacterium]|nr:50S ribosomal protein L30 [Rickettsiales bacterium]